MKTYKLPLIALAALSFSLTAVAGESATLGEDFTSPAEHDMTQEEWVMLHALDDALQNARFYDCRVELQDFERLTIVRAREEVDVDFDARRTEVSTANGAITVNSYSHRDDDNHWYSNVARVVLSSDQKRVVGLKFRTSRFDHVNRGTVLKPDYQTVLTPIEQFYCSAN